jgi:hypothetical protein
MYILIHNQSTDSMLIVVVFYFQFDVIQSCFIVPSFTDQYMVVTNTLLLLLSLVFFEQAVI